MNSVEEMITKYVDTWNLRTLEQFKAGFAACVAPEAIYTDPNFDNIIGVDGIAGLAFASLEQIPIRKFNLLTFPDHHHRVARYYWNVELPEETREGFDCIEFNEKYQITRLISFFGPLKSTGYQKKKSA